MHHYMSERHCRDLAETVTRLGGTVPVELTRVLAAMDAVNAWSPDTSADIATLIRTGELTAKNAAQLLDAARTAPTVNPAEIRGAAQKELVRVFDKAVNDGAGDALLDSVRPAFEAAVAGVVKASAWITPSTQASEVLDLGDEAVAAWRELPKHRQVLDSIDQGIIGALIDGHSFDAIGVLPWMHEGSPSGVMHALFYVNDENRDILRAGRFMNTPNGSGMRGGRWLQLLTTTDITLNSLTRARELRDHHTAEVARHHAEQYAATHSTLQEA